MNALNYNEGDIAIKTGIALSIVGIISWLAVLSPTLIESDAYRYATIVLTIIALCYYFTKLQFLKMNTLSYLCIGWALYAAARFLFLYFSTPEHEKGASEWLYIFPLFFPPLGIALTIYKDKIEYIIAAFFLMALVLLLATTSYSSLLSGVPVSPLIHNNRIHGAVGCGLILVSAFFWLLYYAGTPGRSQHLFRFAVVAAPLIIFLSLLNIYGSKSKGVWLAIALTFPFMYGLAQQHCHGKQKKLVRILSASVLILLIACVLVFRDNIYLTAGPTADSVLGAVGDMASHADVGNAISTAISTDGTPLSLNERLQLWSNAWEVFSAAPLFGSGNHWLVLWHSTRYNHIGYTLMHNGYVEIAIRHGIFGLTVFAVILALFLKTVRHAWQRGIVPQAALHCYYTAIFFYCITLLSNSNNRLAIGESFVLIAGAVAFFCNIHLGAERTVPAGGALADMSPQGEAATS